MNFDFQFWPGHWTESSPEVQLAKNESQYVIFIPNVEIRKFTIKWKINFEINPKKINHAYNKCDFNDTEIHYLGYIYDLHPNNRIEFEYFKCCFSIYWRYEDKRQKYFCSNVQ